jgi:glycosyltransferase involved in cell wall biosynthesis
MPWVVTGKFEKNTCQEFNKPSCVLSIKAEIKRAIVVSDVLGQGGGAYSATRLLCIELARLGLLVECFAQHVNMPRTSNSFKIVEPKLKKGCRWDLPGKYLAGQAQRTIRKSHPDYIFIVGVTRLAGYLLESDVASQLMVWENTNANPGNKFVDPKANKLLNRARSVLSPSNTIDAAIRETYGYRGRLMRLPFWIEDQTMQPSEPPPHFLADFIYLGRRDKDKGIEELIRATAIVAKSFPSVRVLIAGMGDEAPFTGLVSESNAGKNIVFQFFQTRDETMKALASSRALVLPSYHEGYPLVLLEAAQHGIPFIATRVGSISELFENSSGARLIPARDHFALAAAMNEILSDSAEVYARRRTAVHQMFQQLSSAKTVESSLRKVLQDLEDSN